MLAIDTTSTSRTTANTGIQRVTRALVKSLDNLTDTQPVCLDQRHECWRVPDKLELKNIYHKEDFRPGSRRGASRRPLNQIVKPLAPKNTSPAEPSMLNGFIEPEIFSQPVSRGLHGYLQTVDGPSLALYYDATSLKLPELSPKKNTARFPAYMQELLLFDGIAAISATSRQEIIDYWQWLGIQNTPVVVAIPLAVDFTHLNKAPGTAVDEKEHPAILCVGSIEGRKNQRSLLIAAEKLWDKGLKFRLTLVGLANRETSRPVIELLEASKEKGRRIKWLGPQSEQELRLQYTTCHFTVYPSLAEGFGLPVLESLKHGKPCICSSSGAIGEISTQGGCLTVEKPTPEALATAMEKLLSYPSTHAKLCEEAKGRAFRTWSDYAMDILEFHKSLR